MSNVMTLDGKTLKFDPANVQSVTTTRDSDESGLLGTSHLNITFKEGKLPYWEAD